jgi:hypothetical protein
MNNRRMRFYLGELSSYCTVSYSTGIIQLLAGPGSICRDLSKTEGTKRSRDGVYIVCRTRHRSVGGCRRGVEFQHRSRLDPTQSTTSRRSMFLLLQIIFVILSIFIFSLPFPELSRKPHVICMGVYGSIQYTLHDPTPQGLPNAPPSGSWAHPRHSIPLVGSSNDICNVSCARNVIWATFQHISGTGRDPWSSGLIRNV